MVGDLDAAGMNAVLTSRRVVRMAKLMEQARGRRTWRSIVVGACLFAGVIAFFTWAKLGVEFYVGVMVNATPANLFRVLSPTTQVLSFVAVVANWSVPERRWPLIGALVALVLCDVITFTYHYPRNRIMFDAPLTVTAERVTLAAKQWIAANYVRLALVLGGWCATLVALMSQTRRRISLRRPFWARRKKRGSRISCASRPPRGRSGAIRKARSMGEAIRRTCPLD